LQLDPEEYKKKYFVSHLTKEKRRIETVSKPD
jgi:hypothetical protein